MTDSPWRCCKSSLRRFRCLTVQQKAVLFVQLLKTGVILDTFLLNPYPTYWLTLLALPSEHAPNRTTSRFFTSRGSSPTVATRPRGISGCTSPTHTSLHLHGLPALSRMHRDRATSLAWSSPPVRVAHALISISAQTRSP